jgi:nickel-dependent lactate racemase
MAIVELKYGRSSLPLDIDLSRFDILSPAAGGSPLNDFEITEKLQTPINSPIIEEIISAGDKVLIVVPDATRLAAAGQVTNLLVRRLIADGTASGHITIIFATGIHRKVIAEEKEAILTPFIAQRIKTLDHDARDLANLVSLGETGAGIPISLNRALFDHDHTVLVGGVTSHYFAGFTGGRKLVCPGLGSARTIAETHKLAFDCETRSRRVGVGPAVLDGNAVHEAFLEVAAKINPSFAINTIVDDLGQAVDVNCGHWIDSHRIACDTFAATHRQQIGEKRDFVIASCGGWPYDINMIQAHKTLDAAAQACKEGGTIVLIAQCVDGLGRRDFLDWFGAKDSNALALDLCNKYHVNGQTAWSVLHKAERFNIAIVTELDEAACSSMRLKKVLSGEVAGLLGNNSTGYVLEAGAKTLITLAR